MRVNPKMLEPFVLHSGTKSRVNPIRPTTLGHRIVYAIAKDKGVDIYYLDNGDKPQTFVSSDLDSLAALKRIHGDAFILINRNILVNTTAITGVFLTDMRPTPKGVVKDYGVSVEGWQGVVLHVSRRSIKAVRAAYESVN